MAYLQSGVEFLLQPMPPGSLSMGPPLSPRETRRSGRRSAPSVSASASKSPDSDQPPTRERSNTSRTAPASTNHRNKRLKQEDYDEVADDRKQNSASSASSGFNNGNGKGKRKGKDKHEKQSNNGANEEAEVIVEDPPQDTVEDEEEQGITRCVCGSSGAFSMRLSSSSCLTVSFYPKRMTQMLENSWCNVKHAKSGNMDFVWVISQRNRYMMTTTIVKYADPNYMPSCSSKCIRKYY